MTNIERVKLSDIIPDKANANRHTERGEKMIRESIAKYGFAEAGTLDKNNRIIGGNLRAEAVADLDMTDVIVIDVEGDKPVYIRRTDLDLAAQDDPRARELAYALNRVAQVSIDFDPEQVLADINAGVELDGLFYEDEINEILGELAPEPKPEDTPPQIDKAAELAEKWGAALGQVWQLGEHRLAVGDCTDKAVVDAVSADKSINLVFTSPPYADQREYNNNSELSVASLSRIFGVISTDYFVINLGLKYRDFTIYPYWDEWLQEAQAYSLRLLAWNVWDKINATSVRSQQHMFASQHEWLFVFGESPKSLIRTWDKSPESKKREKYYKISRKGQKITTRRQTDGSVKNTPIGNIYSNKQLGSVFTAYAEMSRSITSHPAMFPVELPLTYIEAMTEKPETVCDPFLGSGTTLIACEQLNRKCRGIEIDPGYAAVTLQRWADYTGKEPELISG